VPSVVVARVYQLRPEVGRHVRVDYWDYAVWLLEDGSVWMLDGYCQHVGGPLADGTVRDGCVTCPWHGWVYDLASGCRRTALGDVGGVRAYRAWTDGGRIWADLPDRSGG
jgi:nitrite reductase/ring-hydroxylating ferredoxin subunit